MGKGKYKNIRVYRGYAIQLAPQTWNQKGKGRRTICANVKGMYCSASYDEGNKESRMAALRELRKQIDDHDTI